MGSELWQVPPVAQLRARHVPQARRTNPWTRQCLLEIIRDRYPFDTQTGGAHNRPSLAVHSPLNCVNVASAPSAVSCGNTLGREIGAIVVDVVAAGVFIQFPQENVCVFELREFEKRAWPRRGPSIRID